MLNAELLAILRCPLDPSNPLLEDGAWLVCRNCGIRFPIKDGIPVLIVEEAELPAGCKSIEHLKCRGGARSK